MWAMKSREQKLSFEITNRADYSLKEQNKNHSPETQFGWLLMGDKNTSLILQRELKMPDRPVYLDRLSGHNVR